MKVELVKEHGLQRGERAIMVDGLRWGWTRIERKGARGTSYTFCDIVKNIVTTQSPAGRRVPVQVSNKGRPPSYYKEAYAAWRPTEQLLLEKVAELVEAGLLRHPDAARAEEAKLAEQYLKRLEDAEAERREQFRARALSAIAGFEGHSREAAIVRIVEAMEWARSQ